MSFNPFSTRQPVANHLIVFPSQRFGFGEKTLGRFILLLFFGPKILLFITSSYSIYIPSCVLARLSLSPSLSHVIPRVATQIYSSSNPALNPFHPQSSIYDGIASAVQLGTKRGLLQHHSVSWERHLRSSDSLELQSLRERVFDIETSYENLQTDALLRELCTARVQLEHRITQLKRRSIDAVLEKNREKSQDHTLAWKVFSSLNDEDNSIPIPPTVLVDHFQKVMAPTGSNSTALVPPFSSSFGPVTRQDDDIVNKFSISELRDAVSKINMKSAPGPDGITPNLAKDLFSFLPFFLLFLTLVNFCFMTCWTPDDWRVSVIFVLYKGKGDPLSPDSYRGISLCSIFAKVYERLLLNRLMSWWRRNPRYLDSQFGFRQGASTLDAVFVLRTLVNRNCRENNTPLHAVFIDLKKAFPSVSRMALFERLRDLGVPSPLVAAIRSFYILNIARLRIGTFLSRPFMVTLGLLEGSILSPILFIIVFSFVWDTLRPCTLPDGLRRCKIRGNEIWLLAFADDLVVLSPSRKKLARSIRLLDREFRKFNLEMSLTKTESMTFLPRSGRRLAHRSPPPITVRSIALKQVSSFKYLGVSIDEYGSIQPHVDLVSQKAMLSSKKTADILTNLAITDLNRLKCYFNAFVQAQFYAVEILPPSVSSHIQQARSSFFRAIFKLPRNTPNDLFYAIFPSFTPEILCLKRRLTFFRRALRHDLACVPAGLIFDLMVMYKRTCGWLYESFLFHRSIKSSISFANFDFEDDVQRLIDLLLSESTFSYHYILHSSGDCLSFFRLFPSEKASHLFRRALSQLHHSEQHVVLCFASSQLRWTMTTPSCVSCPLCYRAPWLWEHFLLCPVLASSLASRGINFDSFKHAILTSSWEEVFSTVANLLLVWHFAIRISKPNLKPEYCPDTFYALALASRSLVFD